MAKTTINASMFDPESAIAYERQGTTWLKIGEKDGMVSFTIFMPSIQATAIADAFNNPTPDLLAALDPRLEDVSQERHGEFIYRECLVTQNPNGGFDWCDPDQGGFGTNGCAETIVAALDDIDEYRLDDMQSRADDDRDHALMERRAELTA